MFLKDASAPEREGIMDAASMTNGIVHNDEGIWKCNKLENRSDSSSVDRNTYLAVQ
jgi:hypothetical protein